MSILVLRPTDIIRLVVCYSPQFRPVVTKILVQIGSIDVGTVC